MRAAARKKHILETRALEAFALAIDIAAAQRNAWLVEHCGDDLPLLMRVRELLVADREATRWDLDTLLTSDPTREIPERIGAYKVDGLLGEGGMGWVLRASRVEGGFAQSVAIKLIHLPRQHPAFASFVSRFHEERNILSNLNHPNIAHLYDGGTLEDGTPYLVMELIEGVSITEYSTSLATNNLLSVFVQVCNAVQAAHQQLIVHRDIKPSNVLIQPGGTAKLLDFGIAKVLGSGDAGLTKADGEVGMTLQYASPEQISRGIITTATDVYALGVLLFELLTQTKPFDLKGVTSFRASQIIIEEAPYSFEKALQLSGAHRRIPKDLQRIVQTAMHKDPTRRYASAAAFASDLQAFIERRPVSLRSSEWRYVATKFVLRNRAMVALSVAALLSLMSGLGIALYNSQLAMQQAERATKVTRFLQEVLLAPSAISAAPISAGHDATVAEVVELAAQRVDEVFQGEYEIQAELYSTLAQANRGLGSWDQALALSEKAMSLLRNEVPEDSDLQVLVRLAVAVIRFHAPSADVNMANSLAVEAEQYARSIHGSPSLLHAKSLVLLGQTHPTIRENERDMTAAHGEWIAAGGDPDDVIMGGIHYKLGQYRMGRGRYAQAEEHLLEAIRIFEQNTSNTTIDLGLTYEALGLTRTADGKLTQGRDDLVEAIRIIEESSADNPWVVVTYSRLAENTRRQGQLDEAALVLAKAKEIARKLDLTVEAPHWTIISLEQAQLDYQQGDYEAVVRGLTERLGEVPRQPLMAEYINHMNYWLAIAHAKLGENAMADEYGSVAYRGYLDFGSEAEVLARMQDSMESVGIKLDPMLQ